MSFQSSYRTFALTTSATSAYMALPLTNQNGFTGVGIDAYLVTNPGTATQYYALLGNATSTLTAPTGVSNTTAVESYGTPILPGQQVLVNHNINSTTPYVYGISPSGASSLIITYGSGQ